MVHVLGEELAFPPPEGATEDGVVAVGGDVTPERLLLAYRLGIFPWPVRGYPLLWFSPDPRFVVRPSEVHVGRSLRKVMRKTSYRIAADQRFEEVLTRCATVGRKGQSGTWITQEIRDGYVALHKLGFAHSIEAYDEDDRLVGGLYGVSLGRAFFGESMFADAPDASKIAFATLGAQLVRWGFTLIDCQVHTDHLERFGAQDWPRRRFLQALRGAVAAPTRSGVWHIDVTPRMAAESLGR